MAANFRAKGKSKTWRKSRSLKSRNVFLRKSFKHMEEEEVQVLKEWIEAKKPDSGSNPLSMPSLPPEAPVGPLPDHSGFSPYAGCTEFHQLPISQKTKDALAPKYITMTDIQRASLPHSLCGRDVLGAAKTGSGKTIAFIIPVLEKLYRERWSPEDGVGSIIISPTRELALQLFEELKFVGKNHSFSAGLLIGGCKDIDEQKDLVNNLNILVCTPGRLLQHMDETPNFCCMQLQVLVLDEADRILDVAFKGTMNAIISQLPKRRQTLLFSATQRKFVEDLARLSLKDPEYLSVHAESIFATPKSLRQTAIIVPLHEKLDMLWSFIKSHLGLKILVFLSSCKQVKFVFQTFKKLRPGIPLMCLHGQMKQQTRMAIYLRFCEKESVLFSTDVGSRGLDFPCIDWVVQVDCPEDVSAYIHRVGRTARYMSGGKSILFLSPSEKEMLTKLQMAKVPIHIKQANTKQIQKVSGRLADLLVKYPDLQALAQRAFITYVRSIHFQKNKEVFDLRKLPVEEFSASMGLPTTPKIRLLNKKAQFAREGLSKKEESKIEHGEYRAPADDLIEESDILLLKEQSIIERQHLTNENELSVPRAKILSKKKNKLKINIHRPTGTRVVFDEEGHELPPLAALASIDSGHDCVHLSKVEERYKILKEKMKQLDMEDKLLLRQRLHDRRTKEKRKQKRGLVDKDREMSDSCRDDSGQFKRSKVYFDSGSDGDEIQDANLLPTSPSVEQQEALALKLLNSMHP